MVHSYKVRPHLLDEAAIQKAIGETGFESFEQGLIVDMLIESYTVDLDLLALTMKTLKTRGESNEPIARAA
ncbi:hypothetical protein [Cohaesibacter intestini]|uniref:hypothetical protein n=1 Tax=Cohaesibacter intestini TaxID=2211145 RepID=UPI000DE91DF8|nr:hypothetical protein [Cohaesibacter intestini]